MEFNPNAGEAIPLEEAKEMIAKFKAKHPSMTQSYYFNAGVYRKLLEKPGCVGIRSFHGLDMNDNVVHILVAVDAVGKSIHTAKENSSLVADDVYDRGQPCPPYCNEI